MKIGCSIIKKFIIINENLKILLILEIRHKLSKLKETIIKYI